MRLPASRLLTTLQISRGAVAMLAATLFTTLAAGPRALAQTETVLYSFCSLQNCVDGQFPGGNLIMDAAGNLYGTTQDGGWNGEGAAFRVSPDGKERVLHSFGASTSDGYFPSPGLVLDKKGNFYGTTKLGGTNGATFGGYGTVFKLDSAGTETILYNFGASTADGVYPQAGLVADTKGNLYGTTIVGGENGYGVVFKLTPTGAETILYNFPNYGDDRFQPDQTLTLDKKGNLYGATNYGGLYDKGLAFEVSAAGVYTTLYNFGAFDTDAALPACTLTLDSEGNLYGTTALGGSDGGGTVFKLSHSPSGSWTETILYNFSATIASDPAGGVSLDSEGNLYGTTDGGGSDALGTVFELSATGTMTTLLNFDRTNGANPVGGLLLDSAGNVYGTTIGGGAVNGGAVYEITNLNGEKR